MLSILRKILTLVVSFSLLAPALALAAGGGGAPIVMVSDTRKLTGILAWWGNMYNDSHVQFTVLTIILIPTIGVLFGLLADWIMHFIGLDLKSRKVGGH
jgi:hypothetical protein